MPTSSSTPSRHLPGPRPRHRAGRRRRCAGDGGQQWVRFDLPVPVAVTPGEVYVLELMGYNDRLLLVSAGGQAVTAGTLTLRVREGGPTGTVLAAVQRSLAAPTEGDAWYGFEFAPALPVAPGATYAIELTDSARRFEWLADTGGGSPSACTEPEFAGGAAFIDGVPSGNDFPFATFAP